MHEEQVRAGHIPMLMPTIQSADLWRESGRYDDYGQEMLRITDRHGRDMLYGPTNEELITDIFRSHVTSYKDLPLTLYHIQWKFRDEVRPRFGVMRGREFLMKDGYNFDVDKDAALHAYNRHLVSYLRTYERMGLQAIPMRADSGPIGGDDTHEFLVLADTGEFEVFYDSAVTDIRLGDRDIDYDNVDQCRAVMEEFTTLYARTDETHDEAAFNAIPEDRRRSARGIEVGQIFYFGTKYSDAMGAKVHDPRRRAASRCTWASHGIGVSPPARRDHRGEPRRPRHHLARGSRAVPRRHRQRQAGRRGGRRRLRNPLRRPHRRRHRGALRRPRGTRRRQVRHDGPDRPALAHHRRPARAEERRGGTDQSADWGERGVGAGNHNGADDRNSIGAEAWRAYGATNFVGMTECPLSGRSCRPPLTAQRPLVFPTQASI